MDRIEKTIALGIVLLFGIMTWAIVTAASSYEASTAQPSIPLYPPITPLDRE